ncbi:LysR substrate-binding domain-containing protein, partial [Acidocella aquatica]|uniref:LysR substrate-binding domain-containing protein n=1 Tax=Acidocella aquatica TaxID=1922313 RepID=UPI0024E0FB0C
PQNGESYSISSGKKGRRAPLTDNWPKVEVDVRQKFQFGGIGALFGYEIDMLVTPDPLHKPGLRFTPVFDYEQVLVVGREHPLCGADFVLPHQLAEETLITYPVPADRLDIYTQFLTPAGISPRQHKPIETTDIMLLMVAHGRGVAALPRWLVEENAAKFNVSPVRLGRDGVAKQIFLGLREADADIDYIRAFIELASTRRAEATPRPI